MHVKGIDSRLDLTRFTTRKIKSIPFTYMEYLDLDISYGNGTLGLITFYRPALLRHTSYLFQRVFYTTENSYHRLWLPAVERRFRYPHRC